MVDRKISKPIVTADEYAALLKLDFYAFIERGFAQLNPETRFYRNWHIELLAAKLEAWRRGEIRRLIINVPLRNLKSHCASIALPAWILGHDPAAQILCVSYAQDLADKLARDCRSIMVSPWYRRIFRTRLSPQRQAVQEFVTTAQGYRLSTSVGGVLTGRGADYIIIDDPLKPSEALSDALRRSANEWFDHTLFSRLNDKRTGRMMVIMQRLHEDDLVGHVLEREGWEVLSFSAIAEKDEEFTIRNPYGTRRIIRRVGEVLHPEREPLEALTTIRQTIGEYNFAGQYQQTPAPLGGGLIKVEWFKTYEPAERPERFDQVVQSWDTANKPTELSDYSVCTTWGLSDRRIYLLHVARKRMVYPELKRRVREQADAFKASVILIEDKASGTQLIQELISEGLHTVKRYQPEGDKVMRMNAQTPSIENGFVYLPREAPWLADYLHELSTFPNGRFDDQADSTSQALDWIKRGLAEPTAIAFARQEVARMLHRQGMHLNAVAGRVGATTEQVQKWISIDSKADHACIEAYRNLRSAKYCAKCGIEIPPGANYVDHGVCQYHVDCFERMQRGL